MCWPYSLCKKRSDHFRLVAGPTEEHNSYAVHFIDAIKLIKQRLPGAKAGEP